MSILYLTGPASPQQASVMLRSLGDYIKVAVDIEQRCLAGGAAMHADCRKMLLEHGCSPSDVWGADWIPETGQVRFASLINVRPEQGNRSTEVQSPEIRSTIESIVREFFTSG